MRHTLILIRHGAKKPPEKRGEDSTLGLSEAGEGQVRDIASGLRDSALKPGIILTSTYAHSMETANLIKKELGLQDNVLVPMQELTPTCQDWSPETILDRLDGFEVAAIVGHEPRLSQLMNRLTWWSQPPLFGDARECRLKADSLEGFRKGKAMIVDLPFASRPSEQENSLREKIASKITVSTFLAGFTFSALIELLKVEHGAVLRPVQVAAIIALTWALALFIAAIYMYDQLNMPKKYWRKSADSRPPGGNWWWRKVFGHILGKKMYDTDHIAHDVIYATMIWVWLYMFTPAVGLALIGFLFVLSTTDNSWVLVGGSSAVAVVFLFYLFTRPNLTTD